MVHHIEIVKFGTKWIPIAAILIGLLPGCAGQNQSLVRCDDRQAEEHTQSLLSNFRYDEAISFLHREIETASIGATRFNLLLLLADIQLGIGNLDEAETTLFDARAIAIDDSAQINLAARELRLSQLRELVIPPTQITDIPEPPTTPLSVAEEKVNTAEPLISNSFFETDLRQVLTDLSMDAGIPIIWDSTVQGLVTFEAMEQPLTRVLSSILLPAGYVFSLQKGTYFVGSPKPENPAFGLLSTTEVISLSNIDATEAIALLSDFFQPYVKASMTSNTVCISGPQSYVERIRKDLDLIDQPPTQILIEVVVSEISTGALRQIGLDWSFIGSGDGEAWQVIADQTNINQPTLAGAFSKPGMKLGEFSVDMVTALEAFVQSGEASIRANPRIATFNGRTAKIGLTTDQYFVIATSTSQYAQYNTLQAVSSGISLEITPYASPSGEITVNVKPEVGDVVGSGTNDLPEISRRSASTTVRVRSGETFMIGGLTVQRDKNVERKIPLLGDIPLLGKVFQSIEVEKKDSQIVIFVTPRILTG